MKNLLLTGLAIFLFSLCAVAQNTHSVKGITVDTVSKFRLTATVTVMDAKDSILYKFTHSANDGSFAITGLPAGKFLVLITYPDYADFVERFTLDAIVKEHDFGSIKMSPKSRLLQEVIIKSEVTPIKIKGDTTEFNPKAYVIQPNDKVEDLLRQLPGIQIDKDGKITAQGEPVPKVLLDGEEFFGDDPKLVTRNIRADMVGNIQLYDKKSDQATFTGIDDGVRTKTINIQLKEDKKRGLFGKVDAGIGNDGYYEGQLIYNKFKAKEKFALYGTAANDGKMGLGFQDNSKIGTGNVQISDDGGGLIIFSNSGNDQLDNDTYRGQGLPESKTGGVHYDNKWNKDSETINTNYKIGELDVLTDQHVLTSRAITPTVTQNTDNTSHSDNYTFRQKVDAAYTKTYSPTSNLKVDFSATERNTESKNNGVNTTENADGSLISRNITSDDNKTHAKIFTANAFYSKRFKKPGRTLSWDVNANYNESNITDYYKSDYYTQINARDTIINQFKPAATKAFVLNSNITYSEPITKKLALTINYGLGLNNTTSDRESFNQSAPGVYNVLDPLTSNDYKYNILTNQAGAMFNYREGTKTVITFGTKANSVQLRQIDEFGGGVFNRDYINWMPQATFQYRPATSTTFNFNYNGNSVQPTISQLQPIVNNTDAQNLYIGNPNLQPSFSHSFRLGYNSFKQLTGQFFNVGASYSLTTDAIVSKVLTDTVTAKSTTQSINLTNKTPYSYSVYASMSKKISALDMQVGLNGSAYGNTGYSYNNNLLTANTTDNYSVGISLSKYKVKKYSFYVQGGPSYIFQQNVSPGLTINNSSPGYSISANLNLFLPANFQLTSYMYDNYRGKTQQQPSITTTTWNASLVKSFFKDQNLKLLLSCNNILNQDQTYRGSIGNTITQSTANTIKRFFMFTVSYDFTKFGTTAAAAKK
jgi:hypothetical protein